MRDVAMACEVELPSEALVRRAAALKASHAIAYADAFAAATALGRDGQLWTGDPELLVAEAPWRAVDLQS